MGIPTLNVVKTRIIKDEINILSILTASNTYNVLYYENVPLNLVIINKNFC